MTCTTHVCPKKQAGIISFTEMTPNDFTGAYRETQHKTHLNR